MTRFALLSVLVLAALSPARAPAQPAAGGFRIVDAKANKGKLTWDECVSVPVVKQVEVTVNVNGMNVIEKKDVTVYESVTVVKEVELKGLKVTDGTGKAVAADKVAELLKDKTSVVLVVGVVSEKHRKLFKDTTVFVELPNATAAPAPGGNKG